MCTALKEFSRFFSGHTYTQQQTRYGKIKSYILDRNKLEVKFSLHVFSNVFSCNDKSLDLSRAFINLQRGKKPNNYEVLQTNSTYL